MNYVDLNNGQVVTVRSRPYPPDAPSTIEAPDDVECGWAFASGQWVPPVPSLSSIVVTFRSLAFALQSLGLYEQVKAAALSTAEGEIWWNTVQSTMVPRDHPFVAALGESLGQTPEQLDAVFAAALKLPQD